MLSSALLAWDVVHQGARPEKLGRQKLWDDFHVELKEHQVARSQGQDPVQNARWLASRSALGGAWLQCQPMEPIGLKLDDEDLAMAVGLRFGLEVIQEHRCKCGQLVDKTGLHALSCKRVGGKWSRHDEVNEVIKRGMLAAGISAIIEPPGLARADGKRPDGVTLPSWSRGKPLAWDATIRHTLAESYLKMTSKCAGSAAEDGFRKKADKHVELEKKHHFMPVSMETHGPVAASSLRFLRQLGAKIQQRTGEIRSTEFLLQRISLAVQRGNAACIRGTIPSGSHSQHFWWWDAD